MVLFVVRHRITGGTHARNECLLVGRSKGVAWFFNRNCNFSASSNALVCSWWRSAVMRQPIAPSNTKVLGGKNKNDQKIFFVTPDSLSSPKHPGGSHFEHVLH